MTTTETKSFQSPDASKFRKGTGTDEQNHLFAALSEVVVKDPQFAGVMLFWEPAIQREGEFTKDGKPKTHHNDIGLIDERSGAHFGIEVYGEGTASDDADRATVIRRQGIMMLYYSNRRVNHDTPWIISEIRTRLKIVRAIVSG